MKNAGLKEDSIIVIKNTNDEYVERGHYGFGREDLSIDCIHKLKGLKANITSRFKDYIDYDGKLNIDKENADDFKAFLDEVIIEYELKEINRMTMRQYLERTGKLIGPEDE